MPFIGKAQVADEPIQVSDSCVIHLSKAIQYKTISYDNPDKIDRQEFLQFRHFLEETFSFVHRSLQRIIINDLSYIYEWKGADSSLPPTC